MRMFFLYMLLGILFLGWVGNLLNAEGGQHFLGNAMSIFQVDKAKADQNEALKRKKQAEALAEESRLRTERLQENIDVEGQREAAAAAAEKARTDAQRARERAESQQERLRSQMDRLRDRTGR